MIVNVKTRQRTDLIDITSKVQDAITASGIENGLVHVHSLHTTAAITINESADPAVKSDIAATLDQLIPWENDYRHLEGNSAAHLKTSLIGPSELIPIEKGRLVLGTWQGIFFCDFDGPRNRKVHLTLIES